MVTGIGIGRARYTSYSETSDNSGWDGWLYPILFIVLPIVACLMVIILIVCNLYEYYQRKRRLEQYNPYSGDYVPPMTAEPDKRLEIDRDLVNKSNYNEAQLTYSTIFANYTQPEDNAPVRPLSGWIAPHM